MARERLEAKALPSITKDEGKGASLGILLRSYEVFFIKGNPFHTGMARVVSARRFF